MDCLKVGKLIRKLRTDKNMTQRQLAELMNISDKTVSKWERGLGCPDISILNELSRILEVNISHILHGELNENKIDGGNMKRVKFYVCSECGNILTSSSNAEIFCCGKKINPLEVKKADESHKIKVEEFDGGYFITFNHEMNKEHFVSFTAYVDCDKVFITRLYPEQNPEVRYPMMRGKFYIYCTNHGLYEFKL